MKRDEKKGSGDERFRALVESYGTNRDRWPVADRQAWETFEASSNEEKAWLAEHRRLDELLDDAPEIVPSPMLLRQVAEIPLRHQPVLRWVWPFGRLRNVLALGTAVAAMGMIVGVTAPDLTTEDAGASLDELSTLALGVDVSEELLP